MSKIEICSRLIEEQSLCARRQCPCKNDTLAFAARQMIHQTCLKALEIAVGQSASGELNVVGLLPAKGPAVNKPAREHEFQNRYRKPRLILLCNYRDLSGD